MSSDTAALLASGWILGFVGSGHCLGMCGGIAGALGMADSSRTPLRASFLYSAGRVASYAVLGAMVGLLGQTSSSWLGMGPWIRIAAGLMIVAMGIQVAGFGIGLERLERAGLGVWRRLSPLLGRVGPPDRAWKRFVLGALWGWLPCGLVYSALAAAATTGSAPTGAGFMLLFGLGTVPALVFASSAAGGLGAMLRQRSTRRAAGAVLAVFGLWSAYGGFAALGGHGEHAGHRGRGGEMPPAHHREAGANLQPESRETPHRHPEPRPDAARPREAQAG